MAMLNNQRFTHIREHSVLNQGDVVFNCPAHHGIDLKKNQHQAHRAKGLSQQKHI